MHMHIILGVPTQSYVRKLNHLMYCDDLCQLHI